MYSETIVVEHSLGQWPIRVYEGVTEQEFLDIVGSCLVASGGRSQYEGFRSKKTAVAWVKRLAKNSPDRSSTFILILWNRNYHLYFGESND